MITHKEAPPCFDPDIRIQQGSLTVIDNEGVYLPKKATATCPTSHKLNTNQGRCGVRWVADKRFRGVCPYYGNDVVEFQAPETVMEKLVIQLKKNKLTDLSYS